MFTFPIEKYHFYQAGNKVIAVSTYCKQTVRGTAICADEDNFNLDIGKKLAAARCNQKVALKRFRRATNEYDKALAELEQAKVKLAKAREYCSDAEVACQNAKKQTEDIINSVVNH